MAGNDTDVSLYLKNATPRVAIAFVIHDANISNI